MVPDNVIAVARDGVLPAQVGKQGVKRPVLRVGEADQRRIKRAVFGGSQIFRHLLLRANAHQLNADRIGVELVGEPLLLPLPAPRMPCGARLRHKAADAACAVDQIVDADGVIGKNAAHKRRSIGVVAGEHNCAGEVQHDALGRILPRGGGVIGV